MIPRCLVFFAVTITWFQKSSSNALSAVSAAVVSELPTVSLSSSSRSQLAVLDGSEWASVQNVLRQEQRLVGKVATKYGYMTIVTGRTEKDNQRVVAMQAGTEINGDDTIVYKDSVAVIPDKISDDDAISTYIASLSTIQTVLPKVEGVGGSDESTVSGKSVVLGSNELACFAAEGLASLGVDVSLVSNGNPKVRKNIGKLNVLKPAVGPSKIGFAAHIGKFDSMLDTLNDEGIPSSFYENEEADSSFSFGGTVLELLKTRHQCERYVSTFTHSQSIIEKEGVFGGPGQAEKYVQRLGTPGFLGNPECQSILPPKDFGKTVTMLFEAGLVFSEKQRKKFHQKSDLVKGWTLSDFWEQTTWPRDSSGTGGTRFGLPVVEENDPDEEPLVLETPRPFPERQFEDSEPTDPTKILPQPAQDNPYVRNIAGVYGMTTEIVDKELDSILFLSAKFCKTCKSINPIFTRMARLSQEKSSPTVFAKAEAAGKYGKDLGKRLEVEAVPAFILFRKGQRYGTPLSVSKLPSKKIDKALELLESGEPWDESILEETS